MLNIFGVLHEAGLSSQALLKSCQEETLEQGMGKKGTAPSVVETRTWHQNRREVNNCLKSGFFTKANDNVASWAELWETAEANALDLLRETCQDEHIMFATGHLERDSESFVEEVC